MVRPVPPREPPPDARLANLVAALATGVADAMQEAMCAAAGLDAASASALVALLDFCPGESVQYLSGVVGLTHSGTVRLVDRLVDGGYVARVRGRDGRSRSVTLTPHGATLARRVRRSRARGIAQLLATLSEPDRARLTELSQMLVGTVAQQRLARRARGDPPAGGALCRTCDFAACGRDIGRCPAARSAGGSTAAGSGRHTPRPSLSRRMTTSSPRR